MQLIDLKNQIIKKKSFLCVGLDIDLDKVPVELKSSEDSLFEFSKAIIDETHYLAVAYKINIAFFEAYGVEGMKSLERIIQYLNKNYPELFTIADAKRGDIGNTSSRYAKAFFETFSFDSITVSPYMGKDSIEPFLEFEDKFTILLALTSNEGASDFQLQKIGGKALFEHVIETSKEWKGSERLMYVVGATKKAEDFQKIRKRLPESFLLVPGVGVQGGSLIEVANNGLNENVGLLVNPSRGILYASLDENYKISAKLAAEKIQQEMASILEEKGYSSA